MFGVSLHSLLVHFPITLVIVGCCYDLWAMYSHRTRFHSVGSAMIRSSALAAVAAAGSGLSLAGMSGLGSTSRVTGHAGLALLTTALLAMTAVGRYSAEVRSDDPAIFRTWFLVAELVAVGLIFATTIMGHKV